MIGTLIRFYSKGLFVLIGIGYSLISHSQNIGTDLLQKPWKANWVSVPKINPTGYGVYLFRKSFTLTSIPDSFLTYLSADNRYKLYVNGKLVALGPAKSDLAHWNFDSVDLTPFLKVGENVIAAKVWNEGEYRPEFQKSFQTGLIIQGADNVSEIINTDTTWVCRQDSSYKPILFGWSRNPNITPLPGWYIAGPGENVNMDLSLQEWELPDYKDDDWENVNLISPGIPKNAIGIDATSDTWRLVTSPLPQMELKNQRLKKLRRAEGISAPVKFPDIKEPIKIPANTSAALLLDQTFLTNAFPTLIFSEGKDASITLTYGESLYEGRVKGNRNQIENKKMIGRKDIILSNGSKNQNFTSLAYRTYRYVEIRIQTKAQPLVLEDFYGTFTGYPFKLNAKIETDKIELKEMIDIGWRTARLCSYDTYMDCPYWEQMQYVGDTRIQAMVSFYNSGDDRLVKNAINLIDYSRQPEGVTSSRYPTINSQIIPTFSLLYIGMLRDYMMYGSDTTFIKGKLSGARLVMDYFEKFTDKDGSVKNLPNWFFTDWAEGWNRGMPPIGKEGSSAILDLQLLMAYQNAVDLEIKTGMQAYAKLYQSKADRLAQSIKTKYWNEQSGLYSDTPEKEKYSQHANALAILTGITKGEDAKKLGERILKEPKLTPGSIYFKYYIHQALVKAGLGDGYLSWLDVWRKNIALGLTTWGEDSNVEVTRSDCHAWGASPNVEFFRTVLGIDSESPGFMKVRIEPHLGTIKSISGEMAHPRGIIKVAYELIKKKKALIVLPSDVTGSFIWLGKRYELKGGSNEIPLPD